MTPAECTEALERIEELKRQKAESEGAAKELRRQLKKEFGISTERELTELIRKLESKKKSLEQELDEVVRDFNKKWDQWNAI